MGHWFPTVPIFSSRRFWILGVATLVILPLCLYRDLSKLAKTSFLSLSADVGIVLVVLARAGEAASKDWETVPRPPDSYTWAFAHPDFFQGMGAMAFAYVCHHTSFLVFLGLKERTPRRWRVVSHVSVGFAFVLSMLLALPAFHHFSDRTCGDVLNNFPVGDIAIDISRLLLALTMILTFPMEFFVSRQAFLSVVQCKFPLNPRADRVHYPVSLLKWLFTVVVGVSVRDLGVVLELTGGFSAVFLGYILPAACAIKLAPNGIRSLLDASRWRQSLAEVHEYPFDH